MSTYPRPSCPNHLFSDELGDMEINTRIHKVLAHGADLNPRVGPASLRKGVNNSWVSPLGPIFGCLCQLLFLNTFMCWCRVSSVLTVTHS
jgi:hypothetical protein